MSASTGANAGLSGGFQIASCDSAPDVLRMEAVEDVTELRWHKSSYSGNGGASISSPRSVRYQAG